MVSAARHPHALAAMLQTDRTHIAAAGAVVALCEQVQVT
jgi:hypothetical protein